MKSNNYLVLILFLFILRIEGQSVKDFTNWDLNNYYAQDVAGCKLKLTSIVDFVTDPSLLVKTDKGASFSSISKNIISEYKVLFQFEFVVPEGITSLDYMLSSAGNPISTTPITIYNCTVLRVPIEIIPLSNSFKSSYYQVSISTLKTNLEKKIDFTSLSPLKVSSTSSYYNCYLFSQVKINYLNVACSLSSGTPTNTILLDQFRLEFMDLYGNSVFSNFYPFFKNDTCGPITIKGIYPDLPASRYLTYVLGQNSNTNINNNLGVVPISPTFASIYYVLGSPNTNQSVFLITIRSSSTYTYQYQYISNYLLIKSIPLAINAADPITPVPTFTLYFSSTDSTIIRFTFNYVPNTVVFSINTLTFLNLNQDFPISMPYGFTAGKFPLFYLTLNFPRNPYFTGIFGILGKTITLPSVAPVDITKPSFISYNIIRLKNSRYLVQIDLLDDMSGIYIIYGLSNSIRVFTMTYRDLADGTLIDGKFESVVKAFNSIDTIEFYDFVGNMKTVPVPPLKGNMDISQLPNFDRFYFEVNDINLSDIGCNNTLYFNFTDMSKILSFPSEVALNINIDSRNQTFIGYYIENLKLFAVSFYIPPRLFTSNLDYWISMDFFQLSNREIYGLIGSQSDLRVFSSFADRMPPIITSITRTSSMGPPYSIGWNITIEDKINGFSYGEVRFRALNNDYFEYTKEIFSKSGRDIEPQEFNIHQELPGCINSPFSITYIKLVDNGGATSIYNLTDLNNKDYISPFLYYGLNIPNSSLPLQCTTAETIVPLGTISFMSSTSIDVCSETNDRTLVAVVKVEDNIAVSMYHIPKLYITAVNGQILSFDGKIQEIASTSTIYFNFTAEIPFGFGYFYGNEIKAIISIYGFSDAFLNFGSINETIELKCNEYSNVPVITGNSLFFTDIGGSLTVFGKNFNKSSNTFVNNIVYQDSNIEVLSPSILIINNVLPNSNDITIRNVKIISNTLKYQSNTYIIKANPIPLTITITPVVVIPCLGTPKCGGTNNGDCTTNGCVCKNEWQGNDCLSRTVNTTQPTINSTSPDIDNNISTESPDGNTVELKSLISILSLNEISFDGQPIKEYPLTLWTFTNLTTTGNSNVYFEYKYNKTLSTSSTTNTEVIVNIKWYKVKSVINFAGETLSMNPSTLKYNIEISRYPFSTPLNTLELVFSASLQTNNNKNDDTICSYQENGNVANEDSEYMKLQVNSHSLYGRFIKRGIIDNRVQSISNKFISDEESSDSTSKSSQKISIFIPNYESSIQLDPDFSLLVDSETAESKSDSVCNSSKSGLTRNQLIGIIVGSVVGGLIIIFIIVVIIFKNTSNPKILNAAVKLRKVVGGKS